ncbi:hypothetical protein [Mucilaginibacter pedocola]|uniref:Uncharacterized protein n=1 Tax=Mucilaginibacter pedocola TaxID=1792845 RepID=A0A1S9P8P3_9SPHI|nr:hypothetical protein [Mucilaginibacter pedocola]OOQ56998.1 hypothetical protein BC343_15775 [Mucilaginibacter pedocola]
MIKVPSEIEELESVAIKAVLRLREETLLSGEPFMLNVEGLPSEQCYFEYPDGTIKLVAYLPGMNDFSVIQELTAKESYKLRQDIGLN